MIKTKKAPERVLFYLFTERKTLRSCFNYYIPFAENMTFCFNVRINVTVAAVFAGMCGKALLGAGRGNSLICYFSMARCGNFFFIHKAANTAISGSKSGFFTFRLRYHAPFAEYMITRICFISNPFIV